MYKVEFYYQGECIESRDYDEPFINPQIGDIVNIQFTNPSYNEYGSYWVIKERSIIFFPVQLVSLKQTLMLNIVPDVNHGLWKSDPLYNKNS